MKKIIIAITFLFGFGLQCMEEPEENGSKTDEKNQLSHAHQSEKRKYPVTGLAKLNKKERKRIKLDTEEEEKAVELAENKQNQDAFLILLLPVELQTKILEYLFKLDAKDFETINPLDALPKIQNLLLSALRTAFTCKQFKAIIDNFDLTAIIPYHQKFLYETYAEDFFNKSNEKLFKKVDKIFNSPEAEWVFENLHKDSEEYVEYEANAAKLIIADADLNPDSKKRRKEIISNIADRGHFFRLIPLLVFCGTDIKETCSINGNLMFCAIQHRSTEIVKAFIYYGANPNFEKRCIPLIEATKIISPEIVQVLLSDPRININIQDKPGNTALITACSILANSASSDLNLDYFDTYRNLYKIITMLLKHNANIRIINNFHECALDYALTALEEHEKVNGKEQCEVNELLVEIIARLKEQKQQSSISTQNKLKQYLNKKWAI